MTKKEDIEMTKKDKRNYRIEFNEKNIVLVLCKRICIALIVLSLVCIFGAVIANSYDDKVFSESFQKTGGYVFVDYFFSKLLGGIFGGWSSKLYILTFLLLFVLIVLYIILNTLFKIRWHNFVNNKLNPQPIEAPREVVSDNAMPDPPQAFSAQPEQPVLHEEPVMPSRIQNVPRTPVVQPVKPVAVEQTRAFDIADEYSKQQPDVEQESIDIE